MTEYLQVWRARVPEADVERLMQHAGRFDALHKMHDLLDDAQPVGRGRIMASGR